MEAVEAAEEADEAEDSGGWRRCHAAARKLISPKKFPCCRVCNVFPCSDASTDPLSSTNSLSPTWRAGAIRERQGSVNATHETQSSHALHGIWQGGVGRRV